MYFIQSAQSSQYVDNHLSVNLLAEYESISQGVDLNLAIRVLPEPGWHIYWKNPGDSGLPPQVSWASNISGVQFAPLLFPSPEKIPYGHLVNFGYSHETVLLSKVNIPESVKEGESLEITARLKWLVCKEECLPGEANLQIKLPVVSQALFLKSASEHKDIFSQAFKKLPQSLPDAAQKTFRLMHNKLADGSGLIEFSLTKFIVNSNSVYFFPDEDIGVSLTQNPKIKLDDDFISIAIKQNIYKPVARVSGLLRVGKSYYQINETLNAHLLSQSDKQFKNNSDNTPLVLMLLFAFLGGLILNLMPCVLPILSIKLLGLVQFSSMTLKEIRKQSLVYMAGVLTSFWLLGGVLIVLKKLGYELGWGFQLQSPVFVAILCVLFFLMALNLLGVFEITGTWFGLGNQLTLKEGLIGAFFSGVLTTIAATPCSAPFMSTALGFALTQQSLVIFLIMSTLALGLATPYLLVSFMPTWVRFLPKPGQWMETLKQFLAFPLFATVLWLLEVLSVQSGASGVLALCAVFIICYGIIWLLKRGTTRIIPKVSKVVIILMGSLLAFQLIWGVRTNHKQVVEASKYSAPWIKFDETKLKESLLQNKTVFIDFTADWCVTCKVNESLVLNHIDVKQSLSQDHVVAMVADWTNADPVITRFLQKYNRNSVPAYLIFINGNKEPKILPQILTKKIVLDQLMVK